MSQFPGQHSPPDGHFNPSNSGALNEPNDTTQIFGATTDFGAPSDDQLVIRPLSSEENAAVSALPEGSALLIMQPGPGAGARFLLDADRTTAGRSERADIFLDDVTVSRKHAMFQREGNQFVVRDSGSLNGTYLNRTRIDSHQLRPGDEVQIGKYRMTFHPSPANQVRPIGGSE